MLSEEELASASLLVFANKQDQPGALSTAQVSTELGLDKLKDRQWSIIGSVATTGEGLEQGMKWYVCFCCWPALMDSSAVTSLQAC